jgi:hypothetical protein
MDKLNVLESAKNADIDGLRKLAGECVEAGEFDLGDYVRAKVARVEQIKFLCGFDVIMDESESDHERCESLKRFVELLQEPSEVRVTLANFGLPAANIAAPTTVGVISSLAAKDAQETSSHMQPHRATKGAC